MENPTLQKSCVQNSTEHKSEPHQQTSNGNTTDATSYDMSSTKREVSNDSKLEYDDKECFICKEVVGDLREDGTAEAEKITHCGHRFGDECLRNWLNYGSTCPICRSPLRPLTCVEILDHFDELEIDIDVYDDVDPENAGEVTAEQEYVRVTGVVIPRRVWEDNTHIAPWAVRVSKEDNDGEEGSEGEEDSEEEDSEDDHDSEDENEYEAFSDDEEDSVDEQEIYGYEDSGEAEDDRENFPEFYEPLRADDGRREYIELMERMTALDVDDQSVPEW
jgi:hypothetical protein